VHATVSAFDPASGIIKVLLDDGVELDVDPEAFAASRLRLLRTGQRVRVELTGDVVTNLQILTLP
jgi:2-phospho-L-lactate/phosphoenolpyruvate guanylyltransferase